MRKKRLLRPTGLQIIKAYMTSPISQEQYKKLITSIIYSFESNFHQYATTDESEKAFKFLAQSSCQAIAGCTNQLSDADETNLHLRNAIHKILNTARNK